MTRMSWWLFGAMSVGYFPTIWTYNPLISMGILLIGTWYISGKPDTLGRAVLLAAGTGFLGGMAILFGMLSVMNHLWGVRVPLGSVLRVGWLGLLLFPWLCAVVGYLRAVLVARRRKKIDNEWSLFAEAE
jgi:hypothetical protein